MGVPIKIRRDIGGFKKTITSGDVNRVVLRPKQSGKLVFVSEGVIDADDGILFQLIHHSASCNNKVISFGCGYGNKIGTKRRIIHPLLIMDGAHLPGISVSLGRIEGVIVDDLKQMLGWTIKNDRRLFKSQGLRLTNGVNSEEKKYNSPPTNAHSNIFGMQKYTLGLILQQRESLNDLL
jgi:hypothetical protein